jgi:uncharacterized DUF497 family protein
VYAEIQYHADGRADTLSKFWRRQPDGAESLGLQVKVKSVWRVESGMLRLRGLQWLALSARYPYSVQMTEMRFEWNAAKSRANARQHGVSFEEAQTVFLDEKAIRFFDPDHSADEDRFLMLGISFRLRVLVVCHCHRSADDVVRIISARKANKQEESDYWNWR